MTDPDRQATAADWLVSVLFVLHGGHVLQGLERFHFRAAHLETETDFLSADEVVVHLVVRARSAIDAGRYVRGLLDDEPEWWSDMRIDVNPA